MKILRIGSLPSISKPGMGLAVLRLSQIEDFDTTVISYSLFDDDHLDEVKKLNLSLIPFNNPVMPKSRSGIIFFVAQIRRLLAILRFSFSALLFIRLHKPQIVHLHSPMHFLIGIWTRLVRIPTFVTFHGTDFNHIIESKFYQLCLKPIKHINCVSSHQVTPLTQIFPNADVQLVSNAFDLDVFTYSGNLMKGNKTLIAVGSLRWHKGFDKLIDTFSEIIDSVGDWNLKIVGDGPDKVKLRGKITNLGLERRIQLLGALPKAKLAHELFKADIFILSSITEGLPKVLLEAMRARCSCIAFRVGDCERVLDSSGILVDSGNYDELREQLLKLIESPPKRQLLGERAFYRAGDFSWDRYQDLHKQLYFNASKIEFR